MTMRQVSDRAVRYAIAIPLVGRYTSVLASYGHSLLYEAADISLLLVLEGGEVRRVDAAEVGERLARAAYA